MIELEKILARAQERQNRHMKFGEDGPPLVAQLITDACRQMIHKNYAAAYECMQCALDELSEGGENRMSTKKRPACLINKECIHYNPEDICPYAHPCIRGPAMLLQDENERLIEENVLLQKLWVTVNLSCNPPDDCNDPVVLKRYMEACMKVANKYGALDELSEVSNIKRGKHWKQ